MGKHSHFLVDDELSDSGKANGNNRIFKRLLIGGVVIAALGIVGSSVYGLMEEGQKAKRRVVNITLMKPPPPPPPEVKPPEPEVPKVQEKIPEPETPQETQEAPPDDQLGLDTEGSGSGDAFGLAAKKGGKDITELGGPATVNRAQYAWFTGLVQGQLQEQFQKNDKLRTADYRVVLRVWFAQDGSIERYELVGSSGNPEIDRNLRVAMDDMPRLKQAPPAGMPQPVKLRVTSRGAG